MTQVNPHSCNSRQSLCLIEILLNDLFEQMCDGIVSLLRVRAAACKRGRKRTTVTAREVQSVVRSLLPGQLALHAISEGTKAVVKSMDQRRCGLVFPIGRIRTAMRVRFGGFRLARTAPIYLTGVLELVCAEVCELAANVSRDCKRSRMSLVDVQVAVGEDDELSLVWRGRMMMRVRSKANVVELAMQRAEASGVSHDDLLALRRASLSDAEAILQPALARLARLAGSVAGHMLKRTISLEHLRCALDLMDSPMLLPYASCNEALPEDYDDDTFLSTAELRQLSLAIFRDELVQIGSVSGAKLRLSSHVTHAVVETAHLMLVQHYEAQLERPETAAIATMLKAGQGPMSRALPGGASLALRLRYACEELCRQAQRVEPEAMTRAVAAVEAALAQLTST